MIFTRCVTARTWPGKYRLLVTMKLAIFLSFLLSFHAFAESRAQKITLNAKNTTLRAVMKEIQKQQGYSFFFRGDDIATTRVNVTIKQADLPQAMEQLLAERNLQWYVEDGTIVIAAKPLLLNTPAPTVQEREITGRVTDDQGNPLEGVTVSAQGHAGATKTGTDGTYRLVVATEGATLVFSMIGYETTNREWSGERTLNVTLTASLSDLEEVVVIGYGTQRKADITGSVATVSATELTKTPVAQVSNMLAGRVPGLTAIQGSGLPGSDASSLRIRGFDAPLVLVDNVEGNMNTLDQNEIESITFLKDASAAVYGSRAGNGVILITTKRGQQQAPTITFSQNATFQSVTNMLRPTSSGQNAELIREAHLQAGLPEETSRFTQEEVDLFYAGTNPDYPNTNWLEEVTRKHAPQQQYHVSVRGGNDRVRYYGLVGMLDQQSMFKKNGGEYTRYNLRSNVDVNINKDLDFKVDLATSIENRDFPWRADEKENSVWQDFWNTEPFYPSSLPDPTKIPYANGGGTGGIHIISNSEITGYRRTNSQNLFGTMELNYRVPVVEGLSLKAFGNYRQDYSFSKVFERLVDTWTYNHESGIYTPMGGANNPRLTHYHSRSKVLTGQFYVNYNRVFAQDHHVSGMLLYEVIDYASDDISAGRDNYITPVVDYLFAGGVNGQRANGGAWEMGRLSYVGRVNYAFRDRYLMEAAFRIDESAKFSEAGRRGFFPSISIGWNIANEPFFSPLSNTVDVLKYRASYSQTGNDNVGNFQYLSGYNFGSAYIFGDKANPGLIETSIANPRLTWEEMTIYNMGLDFRIKQGLVYGNIDAFYRLRDKIPGSRWNSLPSTFGAALPTENINSITNRGIEVLIGHQGKAAEFAWDIAMNVGWNRGKWKHYDEPGYEDEDQMRLNRLSGQWTDRVIGYRADGLFTSYDEIGALDYIYNEDTGNASLKPGDIRYLDTNGDGLLNWRDQVIIGNGTTPRWTGGLNLNFAYKGLDLSVLMQGAFFFYQHIQLQHGLVYPEIMYTERWTEESNRADALIPRLGGANSNSYISDYNFVASDYLRLKTVSIGYSIDPQYLSRVRIKGLRVQLSGLNLLTFSKMNKYSLDPEAPSSYAGYYYPQMKTLSFGVNLTL